MDMNKELQRSLLSNISTIITVRLDDSNYVSWRFLVESMLIGCDLMGYIDGSIPCPSPELGQEFKEWRMNDYALITLLAATLSHDALSFIVGSKTSKEVWLALEERYAKLSKFKAFELQRSMQKIRKGEDSIDTYLGRFKTVRDQLCVAGVCIPDYEIVSMILNGLPNLPSAYMAIKAIIRGKDFSVSLPELRLMLLDVEADCQLEIEQSIALLSSQYMGNVCPASASQIATSNVINTNMTTPHGIQWNCSPCVASYACSVSPCVAKEIGEDKAEVKALKRESMKLRDDVEEERKMLQIAANSSGFGQPFGTMTTSTGFGSSCQSAEFLTQNGSNMSVPYGNQQQRTSQNYNVPRHVHEWKEMVVHTVEESDHTKKNGMVEPAVIQDETIGTCTSIPHSAPVIVLAVETMKDEKLDCNLTEVGNLEELISQPQKVSNSSDVQEVDSGDVCSVCCTHETRNMPAYSGAYGLQEAYNAPEICAITESICVSSSTDFVAQNAHMHESVASLEQDDDSSKPMIKNELVDDIVVPQIPTAYMIGFSAGQEFCDKSNKSLQVKFAAKHTECQTMVSFPCITRERPQLNCKQAHQPMQPWRSLPLIPPG